jgi:hypothetical protein
MRPLAIKARGGAEQKRRREGGRKRGYSEEKNRRETV